MVESDRNQSTHATTEPNQTPSKASLAIKYAAILAFSIGGNVLWSIYIQASGPLSTFQLATLVGGFALIGIGIWLWHIKLDIFDIIVTVLVLSIGMKLFFLAFLGVVSLLISYGVIGGWIVEPLILPVLFVASISAIMAINIIRTP
ncbi:hypothetical protein [Pseudovibrio sp. Ad26]|uniref:hypothetical protein n=1 Tax=Pseudovibrio sp. Ad26 TaxID=989410 RepID=UPI0007AE3F36|nr:hypothetical protein [Pseudovibrio sp. Ad26]KZL06007.1 hypothetical protein PsAD26_04154 [Pseudovibrio sp. Ad26]